MTNRLLHVDCQKRFPMYQANSMYQVADFGRGSATGPAVMPSTAFKAGMSSSAKAQYAIIKKIYFAVTIAWLLSLTPLRSHIQSSHRAVPRNHGCCHWCPRHALSPSNHVQL